MVENLDIFDFTLTDEEMNTINALDKKNRAKTLSLYKTN